MRCTIMEGSYVLCASPLVYWLIHTRWLANGTPRRRLCAHAEEWCAPSLTRRHNRRRAPDGCTC